MSRFIRSAFEKENVQLSLPQRARWWSISSSSELIFLPDENVKFKSEALSLFLLAGRSALFSVVISEWFNRPLSQLNVTVVPDPRIPLQAEEFLYFRTSLWFSAFHHILTFFFNPCLRILLLTFCENHIFIFSFKVAVTLRTLSFIDCSKVCYHRPKMIGSQ